MNISEYRKRLYANYYSDHFQENKLNKPVEGLFRRAALGYEWNYGNYVSCLKKNARVLDIGCGIGQCLSWLSKRGMKAVGIDMSAEQLAQARKVLDEDVSLEQADAFDFLRNETGKYGAVVVNDFIEHLTGPEALEFVESVYDVMDPEGIIIVKVPNAVCPSAGHFFDDLTHERLYTDRSMCRLLRGAGFTDIRVFSFDHPPFRSMGSMVAWVIRRVTWNLYRARLFLHDFSPGTKVVGKHLIAVAVKPDVEKNHDN